MGHSSAAYLVNKSLLDTEWEIKEIPNEIAGKRACREGLGRAAHKHKLACPQSHVQRITIMSRGVSGGNKNMRAEV